MTVVSEAGHGALYIEPGGPWESRHCVDFNGRLRDECLNGEFFSHTEGGTNRDQRDRLAFVQTVSKAFPGYFSSCTTYNQQIPALSGKIYGLLLWGKSTVAAGAVAERARIVASGDRPLWTSSGSRRQKGISSRP